ncbi:hypothetical protein VIGAN_01316600, partial [Vigna angularis var. angularis]
PQRSSYDHLHYPSSYSSFQQSIAPTSSYPQIGSFYCYFPPITLFTIGPSTFSVGRLYLFGTSTVTPASTYQNGIDPP